MKIMAKRLPFNLWLLMCVLILKEVKQSRLIFLNQVCILQLKRNTPNYQPLSFLLAIMTLLKFEACWDHLQRNEIFMSNQTIPKMGPTLSECRTRQPGKLTKGLFICNFPLRKRTQYSPNIYQFQKVWFASYYYNTFLVFLLSKFMANNP